MSRTIDISVEEHLTVDQQGPSFLVDERRLTIKTYSGDATLEWAEWDNLVRRVEAIREAQRLFYINING